MYVCMYVCMYECMPCMYVCMHACMHPCMQCMYVCMYACMYVCMYVCMHACMYVCMYVHASIHINIHIYILIYYIYYPPTPWAVERVRTTSIFISKFKFEKSNRNSILNRNSNRNSDLKFPFRSQIWNSNLNSKCQIKNSHLKFETRTARLLLPHARPLKGSADCIQLLTQIPPPCSPRPDFDDSFRFWRGGSLRGTRLREGAVPLKDSVRRTYKRSAAH